MPRGMSLEMDLQGADAAAKRLSDIVHRMLHAEPAFEKVERVLEAGEARHFAQQRGRYVRTGALRDSLTQAHAPGAIREIHGDAITFGTSIFYAKFLRKKKRSAVLVFKPVEKKAAKAIIVDWITGGER